MKVLLPLFYLPPISWFSVFLQQDAEVTLEQFENFPKQTYRNRTVIYGANGRLALIIPILHNGKKTISDIEVSQRENWQKLHWKSIKNAYQSSPYFEFYEDQLQQIFNFETQSLFQFNLNALQIILKILKTENSYSLNEEFSKTPVTADFRNHFFAKKESKIEMEEYYQTFSDKLGFEKDLSILDLICNKGPESLTYLRNVQSK